MIEGIERDDDRLPVVYCSVSLPALAHDYRRLLRNPLTPVACLAETESALGQSEESDHAGICYRNEARDYRRLLNFLRFFSNMRPPSDGALLALDPLLFAEALGALCWRRLS